MSLLRHAVHRDREEPSVVKAFRAGGATVDYLSAKGMPDLLVGYLGVTHLVECKTDNAMPNADQKAWADAWRGEKPEIVRNAAQARKLLRMWTMACANQSRSEALEADR